MYADYMFSKDLETVKKGCDQLLLQFDELNQKNMDLVNLLDGGEWLGEAQEQTIIIQRCIGKYAEEIRRLCTDLRDNIAQATVDATSYAECSEKVNSIKKI